MLHPAMQPSHSLADLFCGFVQLPPDAHLPCSSAPLFIGHFRDTLCRPVDRRRRPVVPPQPPFAGRAPGKFLVLHWVAAIFANNHAAGPHTLLGATGLAQHPEAIARPTHWLATLKAPIRSIWIPDALEGCQHIWRKVALASPCSTFLRRGVHRIELHARRLLGDFAVDFPTEKIHPLPGEVIQPSPFAYLLANPCHLLIVRPFQMVLHREWQRPSRVLLPSAGGLGDSCIWQQALLATPCPAITLVRIPTAAAIALGFAIGAL